MCTHLNLFRCLCFVSLGSKLWNGKKALESPELHSTFHLFGTVEGSMTTGIENNALKYVITPICDRVA